MAQQGDDAADTQSTGGASDQTVWTFRGYRLRPSEFTTAMAHFFRAEVSRANVWRQRLDATTNWAVITTGAFVTFAFGDPLSHHLVILLDGLLVTMFLMIESRRYRYYELWSYRVRLMETDFFASMLVPPFHPSADWAEALAENLLHPHYQISIWEAVGRRLRRNYLWIYLVIGLSWMFKMWLQPTPAFDWATIVQRAQLGPLPGDWVILAVILFAASLITFSLVTIGLQEASGEVLPRYGSVPETIAAGLEQIHGKGSPAWFRHTRRRQQLLTFIITQEPGAISELIIKELGRGVTALTGMGMYTHEDRPVLMCALTVTEVPQLKELVRQEDPQAFVVVTPAQEVFGGGFFPLQEDD